VLLDELGAGTDPVEGAALARAISGRLLERGCLAVCTTHYAELKAFAHNTVGVTNASVEFDVETLAPTYRLTIGLPGRSNALAIASRLGLDASLVEAAQNMMGSEDVQIESMLATIHQEREAAAAELARAEQVRADAEKYRERYTDALREFEESADTRIADMTRQLEHELRSAREELRRLRDKARDTSLSRQVVQQAEQRMHEMQAHMRETGQSLRATAPAPPAPAPSGVPDTPRPLRVGDMVMVRSLGLNGEILGIDEDDEAADVQVGGFRVQVHLDELRREKRKERPNGPPEPDEEAPAPSRQVSLPPVPEVPMSFDMRGWRASEVSGRLDQYLNEAYLAGLPSVRLIHGKGSGVLRQVVRDELRQHSLVASFQGGGTDGGEGVTIAKLVER
jgi:DNA mismatch repair protein MutS2